MSDLISRLSELRSEYNCFDKYERYAYHTLSEAIKALQAQKTGHWIITEVRQYDLAYGVRIYVPEYVCSCCGHWYESYIRGDEPKMPEDADFPKYCEQCGARMECEDDG